MHDSDHDGVVRIFVGLSYITLRGTIWRLAYGSFQLKYTSIVESSTVESSHGGQDENKTLLQHS